MWLVSMSRRWKDDILAAGDWCRKRVAFRGRLVSPVDIMHRVLLGVGQANRERCFRMNVTLCLHRGARPEEIEGLPAEWHADEWGSAGGPVEVLWENGVKALASAMPCEDPGRRVAIEGRPDLWIPVDCGDCPPCKARAAFSCGSTK